MSTFPVFSAPSVVHSEEPVSRVQDNLEYVATWNGVMLQSAVSLREDFQKLDASENSTTGLAKSILGHFRQKESSILATVQACCQAVKPCSCIYVYARVLL